MKKKCENMGNKYCHSSVTGQDPCYDENTEPINSAEMAHVTDPENKQTPHIYQWVQMINHAYDGEDNTRYSKWCNNRGFAQ